MLQSHVIWQLLMRRSWLTLVHAAPGSGKIRTDHRLSEHEGHLWLTKSTFSDRVGTKLYRRGFQIELGEKTQRRRMDLVWRAQLYQQWLKGGAGLRMRERTAQYDAYETPRAWVLRTRFIQGPCSYICSLAPVLILALTCSAAPRHLLQTTAPGRFQWLKHR